MANGRLGGIGSKDLETALPEENEFDDGSQDSRTRARPRNILT